MLKLVFLLSPVYTTLFWAINLTLSPKSKHNTPRVFLGCFMMVAFALYLSHLFYFTNQLEVYVVMDSIYTYAYLLVYPLYHIYVRLLTEDKEFSLRKHGKYLLAPTIVFGLTVAGYLLMSWEEAIYYVGRILTQFSSPSQSIHKYMYWLTLASRVLFVVQAILYLLLSFKVIDRHVDQLTNYYSNTDQRRLNWVQFFNYALAFTSLSSIMLALLGRDFFAQYYLYLLFPSVVFSVMLFIAGYYGYNQKTIYYQVSDELDGYIPNNDAYPKLLKQKLDKLFEEDKVYSNPDLKIWDVTSLLGSNRTYVSRLINAEYGQNFCNYVNQFRVEHAKELCSANPTLTNEQVAEQSGFGSVNSLYRAFMAHEGLTFGEYRKRK